MIILLSHDTMLKQKRRHPDLTESDYCVLRAVMCGGEYRQDTPKTVVITYIDTILNNTNYRAAIKGTDDCKRLYLVSFNKMYDRQLRKERRRPWPIIREHD